MSREGCGLLPQVVRDVSRCFHLVDRGLVLQGGSSRRRFAHAAVVPAHPSNLRDPRPSKIAFRSDGEDWSPAIHLAGNRRYPARSSNQRRTGVR